VNAYSISLKYYFENFDMKKFLKLLLGFSFFVIFTNSYAIEYPFICENDDSQCKKTVSQTITNVNQTYKYLKVLSFDNDNNQTYEDAENAKPYQTFPN
jgi:hypothetical protein